MSEGAVRKLAAIVAADMVGYSRLVESDEMGTLARLKAHRVELIDPAIAKHRGRLVKSTGDGILAEFASVVDAVDFAVEVQTRMGRRNADVPPDRHIRFRIGVNVGDVVFEDGDVFGDGVNIAARIEGLAPPGGICLSRTAHDQLAGKIGLRMESMGDQQLKNIERPVEVFRLELNGAAPGEPQREAASEQPSIAVLPFTNMSGDAEQEFFADGLTEDIITELSRFRELIVISRNSTFVHKGRAVNMQDVAKEFGVQYVVEGSVRKAGNRVRITVQLIDASVDRHLWAERYDRELKDIFAIQDEVTASIVSTLSGRLEAAAHERVSRKPTSDMAAYEYTLAAKVLHHRSRREDNLRAQEMIEKAIASDPNYAHAHAWRACIKGQSWSNGWAEDRDATWRDVVSSLEVALALDDRDSDVHRILAAVSIAHDDLARAAFHQEKALSLNPNSDLIVVQNGEILTWLGRPLEGIEWIRKAMRLNPHHPQRFWSHLARAHFVARQYREAIECLRRLSKPDAFQLAMLAAAHAMLDEPEAAGSALRDALARDPALTLGSCLATLHYTEAADLEHHRQSLVRAGLPE